MNWEEGNAYGTVMRYAWVVQDAKGGAVASGIDIVDIANDGRLARVVGFFDR